MLAIPLKSWRQLLLLALAVGLTLTGTGYAQGQTSIIAPPRVISAFPAQREVVGPESAIQIVFDQAMNRASVEAAFRFEPPENGALAWTDDQTLTFKPNAPLKRGQEYRITIGGDARAASSGMTLGEPFRLAFQVAANLRVGQVVPAPGAQEVEAGATLTIVFDRPVVPLVTTGDQADLPRPLTISPAVEGKGEWVGTSIYVFRPAKAFAGGTLYTATVSGDLKDVDGSPMAEPYTWQFRTVAPSILSLYPGQNVERVPLDSSVTIQFNQPMDRASTEAAFALVNTKTGANVAGTFNWYDSDRGFEYKPASRLELETTYRASLTASARSASGEATLVNPQTASFFTVPYPRILRTDPGDGARVPPGSGARVIFNAPMAEQTFAGKITVEPKPERLNINVYGTELYIGFNSLPATMYTITIDAGVADPYGNTINQPFKFSFSTDDAQPSLAVARRDQILFTSAYRPQTTVLTASINITDISARLAVLELPELLRISGEYGNFELYNYTPPRISREWTQPLQAERNKRLTYQLPLAGDSLGRDGRLPPGIYYLELHSPQLLRFLQPPIQDPTKLILVVATTNLVVKQTAEGDVLVWATDLKTGQPAPKAQITVYDRFAQVVASGTTDASGLARLKVPEGISDYRLNYWITASGEGIYSLTNSRWTQNYEPYQFDTYTEFEPKHPTVYLYTDQPIYRPDRPAYFRGIVRMQDDVTFAVPAGERALLTIHDAQGQEVRREEITFNAYGAFSGKYDIPLGAPLGDYRINVEYQGRSYGINFTVAEFRPPEFLVSATADKTEVAAGDKIKVTIDGRFLFGGPVSNGAVNYTVVANQRFYNYIGLGAYDFAGEPIYVYNRMVATGSGTLDANGQFIIEVPADLGGQPVAQDFTIEASVTDISNQTISGRAMVTVHPATLYIGLRPAKYVGKAGEAMDVNVTTVDWASNPIPGQNVTVRAVERRWEQDPNTLQYSQKSIPVAESTVTTDDKGQAVFNFTPPRAGIYQIEATARDPRERIARTITTLWVQGPDAINWGGEDKRVTLVLDRKGEYAPGETASILIASPFPEPVKALVTVERADIMQTEIVEITGSYTYQLPLEGVHAPNVYVAVAIVHGSGDNADGTAAPDMRYGLINLAVKVQQQLKVKITPSATHAEPGKQVGVELLVTDLNDKPVQAEVGLSMSDVATLSVGAPNSGRIFDMFWGRRGLSVLTSSPLAKLIDDLLAKDVELQQAQERALAMAPAATMTAPGLGGAPPPAPAAGEVAKDEERATNGLRRDVGQAAATPRTNFVDTPLWVADLVTDAGGRAQASVTLPDNLTTWRFDARAIDNATFVGDTTLEIVSTKPLLVRPATPRFFVVGDEVELAMVVNNNTDRDLAVDVLLEAKGVTLRADKAQRVDIPKGGRARVMWLATVEDVEDVDLTFAAASGEFSDASKPAVGLGAERLLPVYKYLAPDYVSTAGTLREPGQRTEGVLLPPPDLAPAGELTVKLNPSLAATTLDGLKYLRNFPYQCIEQTVSRFLPNVITFRALQKAGLSKPELRAELEAAVRYALDRLTREQHGDGGWGWFVNDESNLLTTSYALLGLIEARDADFQIDPAMIERAIQFILSRVGPVSQTTPVYELNRYAFVGYVLARASSTNVQLLEELMRWREKMHYYARAFLALAYDLSRNAMGFQDRIDTLLSDLQSGAVVSATGIHWEEGRRDWWNWDSNTRTTAIVLEAFVRLQPNSELIPNVVRWLMVARRGDAWETTQETAWAVMSLTDWMVASGELKADYTFAVNLNDRLIGEGKATAETLRDTTTLKVAVADMLRGQVNRLTFDHGEGPGALYYTASLHVEQPVEAIKPTNRGLRFERTYYVGDKPVTSARVGDVITVSLEITVENDLYYVVINDPIPAGTEPIDRSLQTSAQIGQQPELRNIDPYRYGWGWWWFSNTELRSEKVVLTATYLPRGSYRFVYQIQATTPGTYRVIPANGNEFYFPEVFGRGAGSLFTVLGE